LPERPDIKGGWTQCRYVAGPADTTLTTIKLLNESALGPLYIDAAFANKAI